MFVVTAIGDGIVWQFIMESNMRKLILNILAVAVTAMTIFSCNDVRNGEVYRLLADVDSYIESRPDSALAVLEGIGVEDLGSREEKAKYALLMSMALDKNYIDRTDFEVLQPAIDYYENHGTATDKLRTFYYQGRIYYNMGDMGKTMESLVKSIHLGEASDDAYTKARNYYAQATLYYDYYNWDKIAEISLKAAEQFKLICNHSAYVLNMCRAAEAYSQNGHEEKIDELLTECEKYLYKIDNQHKSNYYSIHLTHRCKDLPANQIKDSISVYLKEIPDKYIKWNAIAKMYYDAEDLNKATESMERYLLTEKKDKDYYAMMFFIQKAKGSYKEALESYEEYSKITDSLDYIALKQETQFIEERHQLEMSTLREKESKKRALLICSNLILLTLIIIYLITKQLRLRTAEKKQLEIEKKRYEQLYADAIAERDALTKMIEDSSVKDETKAVIRERLEVLNKVIISHITDTSSANKKAFQELEALVADRDSFIESTRLTIEGNNPEFIAALKKQGLTDEEINICCLYVIGLKGKDIKAYTSQPRHYNQSADIRHKLGLTENDTNLSIFLRDMLEK